MKSTNRLSIHFKLRAERTKNGKAPIYLGLTVNGSKGYISLKGIQVDLAHWDITKGSGKSTTKHGRKINDYLEETRLTIREHYRQPN